MNIFTFFVLLACVLSPLSAHAILNVEGMNLAQDEDGMTGNMTVSGQKTKGNSDKQSIEIDGRVLNTYADHSDVLILNYHYGISQDVRDTNKALVHLRHRYQWQEAWGLEAFAQAQRDEFSRLSLRTLLGGGIRYLYQSKSMSINAGLGSFFELEKYESRAGVSDLPNSRLWRGNFYVTWLYALNEHTHFANTIYYQPAWSDAADVRVLDEASLKIAMIQHLDLKISANASYNSRPPAQVESLDVTYKTALEFSF